MKFKYLGTAAAEGWPAMFCSCDACKRAKASAGRNIRTRSQAIIDDRLLIDFPADTYLHVLYHGLDLTRVNHCLITHDHTDHYHPEDFDMRQVGFAYLPEETSLTVYGPKPAGEKLRDRLDMEAREKEDRLHFQELSPYQTVEIAGYQVTPLKADHAPHCEPVIYLIADLTHAILYANDTGWFPDESWAWLAVHKPHLDFVSLDCTCILQPCRYNHMDLKTCMEVKARLLAMGCADEKTRFILHHFSHNGRVIYDDLVPLASESGFDVSFDGMEFVL